MHKTCSKCGNENPERALFCGKCGQKLAVAAELPGPSAEPRTVTPEEKRVVSERSPDPLPESKSTAQLQATGSVASVPGAAANEVASPVSIPPAPTYIFWLGLAGLIFGPALGAINWALVNPSIEKLKNLGAGPGSTGVLSGMIWMFVGIGALCALGGLGLMLKRPWGRWLAYIYAVVAFLGLFAAVVGTAVAGALAEMEWMEHPPVGMGTTYVRFVAAVPMLAPMFGLAQLVLLMLPPARAWASKKWPAPFVSPLVPVVPGQTANASADISGKSPYPANYAPAAQLSMLALFTLILSLTPFLLLPQLASLVTGFLALRKIKRSRGSLTGRGFAVGGICISSCILLFIGGIVGLVVTIAVLEGHGKGSGPFRTSGEMRELRKLSTGETEVKHLEFSPLGDRLVASAGGDFHLWNAETGTKLSQRPLDGAGITFSQDGTQLLAVYETLPPTIRRFDSQAGAELSVAREASFELVQEHFVMSSEEPRHLAGNVADQVYVWDLESGREVAKFLSPERDEGGREYIESLALSPDGQTVLLKCSGKLYVCDAATGNVRRKFEPVDGYGSLTVIQDGRHVLGVHSRETSYVDTNKAFNLESGRSDLDFPAHRWGRSSLAFSRDGKLGISGGRTASDADYIVINGSKYDYGHEVFVWKVGSDTHDWSYYNESSRVTCVALSPSGKKAAAGYANGTVVLLEW